MTVVAQHDADFIELTWCQMNARRVLPPGLHGVQLHHAVEPVLEQMALTLQAYVLGDQGGEPVSNSLTVTRKVRPWWIPKWLWARIDNETRTVSVTAYPKWTYPSANIKVPKLGDPVRVFTREASLGEWR